MNWIIVQKKLVCLETGVFYEIRESVVAKEWIIACGGASICTIATFRSRHDAADAMRELARICKASEDIEYGTREGKSAPGKE